jgi:hypothetical protein
VKAFDARGDMQVQGPRVFHAQPRLHGTAPGLAEFLPNGRRPGTPHQRLFAGASRAGATRSQG